MVDVDRVLLADKAEAFGLSVVEAKSLVRGVQVGTDSGDGVCAVLLLGVRNMDVKDKQES